MGVKFSIADSESLIQAMKNNITLANEIGNRLKLGSDHLRSYLKSGSRELVGTAFDHGDDLFSQVILPAIDKVHLAIEDVKSELSSYEYAHGIATKATINGFADLDEFKKQLNLKKKQLKEVESQIQKNNEFLYQVQAVFTGDIDSLNSQNYALQQIKEQLEMDIRDYQERISKLEWFVADVSRYFEDSLDVLKQAIYGAVQLGGVSVDTNGYYYINGADMSWFSKIQNEEIKTNDSKYVGKSWKLPKQYQNEIDKIKSSNASNKEKAKKIVDTYERYLYETNKEGFNDYANVRKKYSVGSSELNKAEKVLTNYLIANNVDMNKIIDDMGDNLIEATIEPWYKEISPINRLWQFDLKNNTFHINGEETDWSIWGRGYSNDYYDKSGNLRSDYLGNYLYGYYGKGSGAVQEISNRIPNIPLMNEDDIVRDLLKQQVMKDLILRLLKTI